MTSVVTAPRRAEAQTRRPRRVSILGSTGSVGQNTIDLLLRHRDEFTVEALTANRNAALLADQARKLGARFAAVADPAEYAALKDALGGTGIEIACGRQALVEAAERPADWLMAGIVGGAASNPLSPQSATAAPAPSRNGPPLAVRMILSIVSARSRSKHCQIALCSLSTGNNVAPERATSCMTSDPSR